MAEEQHNKGNPKNTCGNDTGLFKSKQFKDKLMIKLKTSLTPAGKNRNGRRTTRTGFYWTGLVTPTTFFPVKVCGRDEQFMTLEGHSLPLCYNYSMLLMRL